MKIFIPANTLTLLNKLIENGYEAYIVGGFVRDALLNKVSYDCDIATSAKPHEIEKVFKDYTQSNIGKKHGTIGVLFKDEWYEITTYRSDDNYSDYRRPDQVTFVKNLNEDLIRRDFTINALALDFEGKLIDIVDGEKDLNHKLIRCVGEANQRFQEDALRILRALRFASTLHFKIEESTASALHTQAQLLSFVAIERIMVEFHKFISSNKCADLLYEYKDVFMGFLPELNLLSKNEIELIDKCLNTNQKYLLIYSKAAFEDVSMSLRQLRLSKAFTNTLLNEKEILDLKFTNPYELKKALSMYTKEQIKDALYVQHLLQTNKLALNQITEIEDIVNTNSCVSLRQLNIRGQDLFDLGLKERQISDMLDVILDTVMQGKLVNDKEAILEFVKGLKP